MAESLIIDQQIIDQLSSDNFEERYKIINFFSTIEDNDVYKIISDLLYSEDAITRNVAIEILTKWGSKVLPVIIERTKDPSPNQRIYAANIIGDIKDPEGINSMLTLLMDIESNVRFAAAEAIGKIGSKDATMPLLHYLHSRHDAPWEQFPLILTLGQLEDERAVIPLLQLAENEMLKQPVLQALSNIADEHAIPYIIDTMKTLDTSMINMAILAIKNLKDKTSKYKIGEENLKLVIKNTFSNLSVSDKNVIINNLKNSFSESDYSIKIGSIFFLGLTDSSKAIDILVENYILDLSPEIEESLLELGKNNFIRLIENLKNNNINCPEIIIKILGQLKIDESIPYIEKYLNSSIPDIKIEAINALSNFSQIKHISLILNYINDNSTDVQNTVINAMQKYEKNNVLATLENFSFSIGDKDLFTVKILTALIPTVNIDDLLKFSNSDNHNIKRVIASALKKYNDNNGYKTLLKFVSDTNFQVREEAIRSLEQSNNDISEILVSMIYDPSDWVRYCVARAFSKQKLTEKTIDSLKILIGDEMPFVRIASIESIGQLQISRLKSKLFDLGYNEDSDIAQASIISLSNFVLENSEQKMFENLLEKQMSNKDWIIRKAVAKSLIKVENAFLLLLKMLEDEFENIVQNEIINSLGQLSNISDTLPLLIKFTLNENLHDSAIETMINMGQAIVPYLQKTLETESIEVKINIIAVLARINDDKVIQILVKQASDSVSPSIRKHAIIALGNFKNDQRAIWAIMWAANHESDSVIKQTAQLMLVS